MLCLEWTLVKSYSTHLIAEPLKCKRWSCDYCQPFRAAALKRQAENGKPDTFLTLTVNPKVGRHPDHRARKLVRAWCLILRMSTMGADMRPAIWTLNHF